MPSTNSKSKTAGVVLDAWKIAIFKKHLLNAGYNFVESLGLTPDTLLLQVSYEDSVDARNLQTILEGAQAECHEVKFHSKNPPPASQVH